MDYKKHLIMKFNFINHIKELEYEKTKIQNQYLQSISDIEKLKIKYKYLEREKNALEDDNIQLATSRKQVFESPARKAACKKSRPSKNTEKVKKPSKAQKKHNRVKAKEVKTKKYNEKQQKLELNTQIHEGVTVQHENVHINIHMHKKIETDLPIVIDDSDNDSDNESDIIHFTNNDTHNDNYHNLDKETLDRDELDKIVFEDIPNFTYDFDTHYDNANLNDTERDTINEITFLSSQSKI